MFNLNEETEKIWVEVASGERQCIPPTYSSLGDAISQLTSNEIRVYDEETVSFATCSTCTCPTGIIYRAQIGEPDLEEAQSLGWIIRAELNEAD